MALHAVAHRGRRRTRGRSWRVVVWSGLRREREWIEGEMEEKWKWARVGLIWALNSPDRTVKISSIKTKGQDLKMGI